jgi:hypothetical protein
MFKCLLRYIDGCETPGDESGNNLLITQQCREHEEPFNDILWLMAFILKSFSNYTHIFS